jgi:hypothetical protein
MTRLFGLAMILAFLIFVGLPVLAVLFLWWS